MKDEDKIIFASIIPDFLLAYSVYFVIIFHFSNGPILYNNKCLHLSIPSTATKWWPA